MSLSKDEAGRILGVAEWEIIEVDQRADGWFALVHDSASHTRTWRHVPGWQLVGERGPELLSVEESEAPVGDLDGDGVPDGSAGEVLAWVDGGRDRAGRALAAEAARDKPRSTLIAALEKLTG